MAIAWNSPPVLAQCLYAFQAVMWLSIGIYAYDCCNYIAFDWSIVRGTRHRRWAHVPYVFSKVSAWAFFICVLVIVHSGTEIKCNSLMRANQVLMSLNMISCSLLLAFRCSCVYTGNERKYITVLLAVLMLGVLAVWLSGTGDVVSVWAPHAGNIWQQGLCIVVYIPKRYSAKYIVTIVYDLLVMSLTIAGVLRMKVNSRVGTILMRQGVQYFAISAIASGVTAGLTLADLNPLVSIIGGVPSCAVCVMCVTRLMVGLADQTKPATSGVYLAHTSSSKSQRIARLFKREPRSTNADDEFIAASTGAAAGSNTQSTVEPLPYGQSSTSSPVLDNKDEKFALPDSDIEAQSPTSSANGSLPQT